MVSVSDASQEDNSKHLVRYTEQCDASMNAAIPVIRFALPQQDDHTLQQVWGKATRLPGGSQDNMPSTKIFQWFNRGLVGRKKVICLEMAFDLLGKVSDKQFLIIP